MVSDANQLDFLEALDRWTRTSPAGEVPSGYQMHEIARDDGLVRQGETRAAFWTGQLVDDGYVRPRPRGPNLPPIPRGVGWTDGELQSHSGFLVTPLGREEAERVRRRRREEETDATIGGTLGPSALALGQHLGLVRPFADLCSALDQDRYAAVAAAAKDLVEAACKGVLGHAGVEARARGSLSELFADARRASGITDAALGRSLAAIVQRTAELRNKAGSGHGRAGRDEITAREARLVAAAACAITNFLSAGAPDSAAGPAGPQATWVGER